MSPCEPLWVEEELILALDLYLRKGLLSKKDPAVKDLSDKLRNLPFHFNRPNPKDFRNPTGVYFHLASFATLDPNHPSVMSRATMRGVRGPSCSCTTKGRLLMPVADSSPSIQKALLDATLAHKFHPILKSVDISSVKIPQE